MLLSGPDANYIRWRLPRVSRLRFSYSGAPPSIPRGPVPVRIHRDSSGAGAPLAVSWRGLLAAVGRPTQTTARRARPELPAARRLRFPLASASTDTRRVTLFYVIVAGVSETERKTRSRYRSSSASRFLRGQRRERSVPPPGPPRVT